MGKIDIDYQKLHDAFFKWQSKPKMTIHGDLYYEGKEFETKMKDKKPGELSDDLRIALGMPVGASANKVGCKCNMQFASLTNYLSFLGSSSMVNCHATLRSSPFIS